MENTNNRKWSDSKKWIMGVVASLVGALIIYVVSQVNKHKYYGESEIKNEYYLLISKHSNLKSAKEKYDKLKRLSELSLEANLMPDTLFLKSSNVNIGYGEDQVILARGYKQKNSFIVGLDLLSGQSEPDSIKKEAEILKLKIKNRLNNINHEISGIELHSTEILNEIKKLSIELHKDLENIKVNYYSNSDYLMTYGYNIK